LKSGKESLCVALDFQNSHGAKIMATALKGRVRMFKVGCELFSGSPGFIDTLNDLKAGEIFLDLKLLDVPKLVAQAVRGAVLRNVSMITVHALGGKAMMEAAVEAARDQIFVLEGGAALPPKIIAVTILTTISQKDLQNQFGLRSNLPRLVIRLARLAQDAGCAGVVCAANEVKRIKQACGEDFLTIVPGIRPKGISHDDHQRIATPTRAKKVGVDWMVVGRPITRAADPVKAALAIINEWDAA
jgi:orotidine-5'-phosphate decarboxylase